MSPQYQRLKQLPKNENQVIFDDDDDDDDDVDDDDDNLDRQNSNQYFYI